MNQRKLLAQVRRIQVRTNRLVTDVMSGGYSSVFRGTGIEFDEVREFVEGDDLRSVDWNVTARTGRPHVKKFMEERELTVLMLLDLSASMRFGTVANRDGADADADAAAAAASASPGSRFGSGADRDRDLERDDDPEQSRTGGRQPPRTVRDAAAEFCACIALAAARNNDKAGLIAFTDRVELYVPARKGTKHVTRLIRDALGFDAQSRGSDLAQALDYAARVQRKRAVIFVVSDFLTGDFARPLRLLARRHDVIAVAIHDPVTLALPDAGLLHLRDPETGRAMWIDSGSARVRKAHAQRVAGWQAQLSDTVRRAGVDLLEVMTDRSVADAIVKFFRMRELRGARG